MISSSDSCRQLVAGNYDVILDDDEVASFKTVLSEFLTRFEHHENELIALQQQPASGLMSGSYVSEFKMLKELSRVLKEDTENFIDGLEFYNQAKNRYKDIIPFNHTRVILNRVPEQEPGSDYINANYVRGPSGSPKSYIACQGPLPHTLNDFWRMIWDCRVSVVVMACNEQEMGKSKCEQYWPDQVNCSLVYGNIQVTLMRVRQINSDFLIRKFSVQLLEPEDNNSEPQRSDSAPQAQPDLPEHLDQVQQSRLPYCAVNQQVTSNSDSNNNTNNNNTQTANATLPQTIPSSKGNLHSHSLDSSHLACSFSNSGNSNTSNESINTSEDSRSSHANSHQRTSHHNHHQDDPSRLYQKRGGPRSNRTVLMERTVCQFHFQGWQDHGVPDSVQSILELVRLIREVQPGYSSSILVHCSAGCGRTGTICCIDYVYGLMRLGRLRSDFDLFTIISEMRQQRMAMVQTIEQYILCHRAVASLFMQQLQIFGFGINQSRCGALDRTKDDSVTTLERPETEADSKSNFYDTSSSTEERQSNSNCSFEPDDEEQDEDQNLGPVFI